MKRPLALILPFSLPWWRFFCWLTISGLSQPAAAAAESLPNVIVIIVTRCALTMSRPTATNGQTTPISMT